MKISIILPIFNEEKNLPLLFASLYEVIGGLGCGYEIIAVNDHSKDKSLEVLRELAKKDKNVKVISFRVNGGQTAALSAGIAAASGGLMIPMDSDMENDPKDIPKLIDKLDEGYDVVSGWRKDRWNGGFVTRLKRRLPSACANWLISKITKVKLHDYGCILKVYKADVLKGVALYGEMHRFIPAYASWRGAKVAELPVNYQARRFGKSNYGMSRTFRVLLDLVTIKFFDKYMNRPMHFFGGIGFATSSLGILAGLAAILLKVMHIRDFVATPLPIFSAMLVIVGVQLVAMGVVAEMLMRTYYESQGKKPYIIAETINL